jgi:Flp pilus assembly pilin Flp
MLLRFISDDRGQDLIEYALLSMFIGICAVTIWVNIEDKIEITYKAWDTNVQNLSSCTPNPIANGGGGC